MTVSSKQRGVDWLGAGETHGALSQVERCRDLKRQADRKGAGHRLTVGELRGLHKGASRIMRVIVNCKRRLAREKRRKGAPEGNATGLRIDSEVDRNN